MRTASIESEEDASYVPRIVSDDFLDGAFGGMSIYDRDRATVTDYR